MLAWLVVVMAIAGCGAAHHDDTAQPSPPGAVQTSDEIAAGKKLLSKLSCAACHGAKGQGGVGPSFRGIWGTEVRLTNGKSAVVDAAYVRESILKPQAKVVKGFSVPMPRIAVNDIEIRQITAYIESLKQTS